MIMSNYRAVGLAEGFEEGTSDEVLAAWQHLIDTGLAWRLQGWFGRYATELIATGICTHPPGTCIDYPEETTK